ncbi:acyl carrier protein [Actinomadura rayongensis]|uniref:Acyl carrier protein n=1 Tax=Actinomadura rayongensis TaxID=1429076 RepID=A0A6I4W2S9_9ACTN|nr:acyl carrier protein [Actinomadura rayongensis]MXQ63020.1 acyl carrier protein [Actinomadura rayongensis]
MEQQEFTLADLARILLDAAGAVEGAAFDEGIVDAELEQLGYDSLAILETGSRIEREYGITLDDGVLVDARTPRAVIEVVNAHLAARAA